MVGVYLEERLFSIPILQERIREATERHSGAEVREFAYKE